MYSSLLRGAELIPSFFLLATGYVNFPNPSAKNTNSAINSNIMSSKTKYFITKQTEKIIDNHCHKTVF